MRNLMTGLVALMMITASPSVYAGKKGKTCACGHECKSACKADSGGKCECKSCGSDACKDCKHEGKHDEKSAH